METSKPREDSDHRTLFRDFSHIKIFNLYNHLEVSTIVPIFQMGKVGHRKSVQRVGTSEDLQLWGPAGLSHSIAEQAGTLSPVLYDTASWLFCSISFVPSP